MKDSLAQKAAVEGIKKIKGDRAVKTLLCILKNAEDIKNICQRGCVIREVIETLVRIGEPSVKPLIQAMRGKPLRAYCTSSYVDNYASWRA